MRLLILIIFIFAAGCGQMSGTASKEQSVVGSWQLMGFTKKPFPIEKITESTLIGGKIIFKPDGTFEGEVIYPKTPERNLKVDGTYAVENGIITINNRANNSTIQSTLRFEKDFMIQTPMHPDGFTAYYKRLN